MKYQKKPVVVDVWKLDSDTFISKTDIWIQQAYVKNHTLSYDYGNGEWNIRTLEGIMIAKDGDYLIKGVHGEIYSCKPDIFEETYVRVD